MAAACYGVDDRVPTGMTRQRPEGKPEAAEIHPGMRFARLTCTARATLKFRTERLVCDETRIN
jgi:hypothetical protein